MPAFPAFMSYIEFTQESTIPFLVVFLLEIAYKPQNTGFRNLTASAVEGLSSKYRAGMRKEKAMRIRIATWITVSHTVTE